MFDALAASGLTPLHATFLAAALLVACGFEFVNGFHDTANAVATVIYTGTLKPIPAVVLSGTLNFIGVLLGGIAVAMGILKLLPTELLVSGGAGAGLAMVLALLLGAILWNLGTWFLGIPASSSHTLIGAIIGVGLANSLGAGHHFGDGVNWAKATDTGLALLVSPLFGFGAAAFLFVLFRALLFKRYPVLFEKPPEGKAPPFFVRLVLIGTCSGVSFAHGQNDGQKGVGLMMLILIGAAPAGFALDWEAGAADIGGALHASAEVRSILDEAHALPTDADVEALDASMDPRVQKAEHPGEAAVVALRRIGRILADRRAVREIPREDRFHVRQSILLLDDAIKHLKDDGKLASLSPARRETLEKDQKAIRKLTDYAPTGVLLAVAISLGLGTMIGWRRIVTTIGEKIGKANLTYAQGMFAELVAATTIYLAGQRGWPVSTTHVLSSGVAGTMVAAGSGLQATTVRNIVLAWVLTLPASMLLAGGLFLLFRLFM